MSGNSEKRILRYAAWSLHFSRLERGIKKPRYQHKDTFSLLCLKATAKCLQNALEKCGKVKLSGSGINVDINALRNEERLSRDEDCSVLI